MTGAFVLLGGILLVAITITVLDYRTRRYDQRTGRRD